MGSPARLTKKLPSCERRGKRWSLNSTRRYTGEDVVVDLLFDSTARLSRHRFRMNLHKL
jgi:hypothetical protein